MLVLDVTQAAAEVSRLIHEAHDLSLPVEPGVRDGRDALVRWAVLVEDVIPKPVSNRFRPLASGPVMRRGRLAYQGFVAHRPG